MFVYNISKSTVLTSSQSYFLDFDYAANHIVQCTSKQLADTPTEIPLQEIVVFCGPSGSGKSSLAIDTILAEGQRRCVEDSVLRFG